MSFLRSLDLYKVIVLLSLVLLPAGGWWVMDVDEQIEACKKAIGEATRTGGLLEQIGALQKKVEVVVQNRMSTSDATKMPDKYFDNQIVQAASQDLNSADFSLDGPKEEPAVTGSAKQRASDFVMGVEWKRKDFAVKLGFVYAVLFNCESGARIGGDQTNLQSIWKLRELQIVNVTDDKLVTNFRTPPPELEDRWSIKVMKFARREPRKDTRSGS